MPDAAAMAAPFPDAAAAEWSLLHIRRLGGRRLVAEMLALYLPDGARSLDEARRALAAGDRVELARAVHALKSGSGQLGAMTLLEACERTEREAKHGELATAAGALAEVERHFAGFAEWLRSEGHTEGGTEGGETDA